MRVVAVDPGNRSGVAIFDDGLLSVAYVLDGAAVPGFVNRLEPSLLVIEVPQIYRYGGKGDPNLLRVCFRIAYMAAGAVCGTSDCILVETTPANWKGQVPKAIHQRRLREMLSPREAEVFDFVDHNGRDAIGLGLWHLKRKARP